MGMVEGQDHLEQDHDCGDLFVCAHVTPENMNLAGAWAKRYEAVPLESVSGKCVWTHDGATMFAATMPWIDHEM
jgi:hypothetical protein